MPPAGAGSIIYRVSNAGTIEWRPAVTELIFYEDHGCTNVVVPHVDAAPDASCAATGCALCSSWDNVYGNVGNKGCQLAFDNNEGTSWRAGNTASSNVGGTIYDPGSVWIAARFDPAGLTIGCITAAGITHTHDNGIQVHTSTDGVTWTSVEGDGYTVTDQFTVSVTGAYPALPAVPCRALCPVPCALCPVPCALCPVPCAQLCPAMPWRAAGVRARVRAGLPAYMPAYNLIRCESSA
jgi:hypothetical protein